MVEEKQENRELEMQKRLEEEKAEEFMEGIKAFRECMKRVAEVFLKIWRRFKTAYEIELQRKEKRKKRYESHLKRIKNRDKLYEKRRVLGRV